MQSTSVAPLPLSTTCWYPIPTQFLHFHHLNEKPHFLSLHRTQIPAITISFFALPPTTHFSKQEQKRLKGDNDSYPDQNSTLFAQLCSSTGANKLFNQNPEPQNQEQDEEKDNEDENLKVLSSNMWWANLKAALGQRINVEGIVSSAAVFVKDRHLALPHVSVPDITYIDWAELHRRGFRGVVFDKDNTITAPYSLTLWGPLSCSVERCKSVFGHDIAVFSNSSGLLEYDHDGTKARTLEGKIGIKVIRHRVKKPAGTAEEIEKHFGCKSAQLIMVGDRPFTDVVFGNRNGFLTVLTEPLSLAEEPFIVKQVRKLELLLVKYWFRRGLKPISHSLLPDPKQCVKDPPLF